MTKPGPTVLRYLWPYRYLLLFALVQVALISFLELLKPWPLKLIIDHVLTRAPLPWEFAFGGSPQTLLLFACLGLVVIYLLLGGLRILSDYVTVRIGQRMVHDLRGDLYSHIQGLPLSFYSQRQTGDLLYRLTADTLAIQTLTMNGLFTVFSALILLGGMFVIMLFLDWYLTLLAMAVCPALFCTIALLNNKMSVAATEARQKESTIYSLVHRTLSAIRVIQAFTKEEEEQRRFLSASKESLAAGLRLYTLQNFYYAVVNVMIAAGTATVLWVGTRHVFAGELTVGEMVVFTSYLASLYAPLNNIFQTYGLVQSAKVGVRRAFEILESEQGLPEGRQLFSPTGARGEISFEEVSFGYHPGQPVLKGINLKIAPGEKIALVGATGVGKSTLVSLLPRFYDPESGRVLIDNVDAREFQLRSLRQQITMVLQPPWVFPVPIWENIAYGCAEASREEIEAAARLARIHDFIVKLPQGYETLVGEQGVTLSEGEKQRLTIARAILRNSPIVILDEPTSSLDPVTESLLMKGLQTLLAGKTALIIAHRLSTVRWANRIVVLHDGRIVEEGSFAELLRNQGTFASLYSAQFGNTRKKRDASR